MRSSQITSQHHKWKNRSNSDFSFRPRTKCNHEHDAVHDNEDGDYHKSTLVERLTKKAEEIRNKETHGNPLAAVLRGGLTERVALCSERISSSLRTAP